MEIDLEKTKNFVVELEDFYSNDLRAMCHVKIVNNNLELTIDYEGMQFALWEYYKLKGVDKALEKSKVEFKKIYEQQEAIKN